MLFTANSTLRICSSQKILATIYQNFKIPKCLYLRKCWITTSLGEPLIRFLNLNLSPSSQAPVRKSTISEDKWVKCSISDAMTSQHLISAVLRCWFCQGERACPGKRQRQGKNPVLRCHLIDLDALHHLDVISLHKFLSDDAEILGRRTTGLCAKCQRKVESCYFTLLCFAFSFDQYFLVIKLSPINWSCEWRSQKL